MATPDASAALVVSPDLDSTELEDWGPLPEATGAPMATAGRKLWTGEGVAEVGIWRCAPGPSRWSFDTHESFTMLAGRMTVVEDGGATYEIAAGGNAVFTRGWSGTWEIHETVVKIYNLF